MTSDFIKKKYGPFQPHCKKVVSDIEIIFDEAFGEFTDEERDQVKKDVDEKIGTTYTKIEWCEKHIGWIVWDNEEEGAIDEDSTNANMKEFDEWMKEHDTCEGFVNSEPHAYIDMRGAPGEGWIAIGPDDVEAEGKNMTVTYELMKAKLGRDLPIHYNI